MSNDGAPSPHRPEEDPMSETPTAARVQLALDVDDLEQSVRFYTALLGTPPAKVRPGYANVAVTSPPLKLVLLENPGKGGGLNHLGVELPSSDEVRRGPADRRRGRHDLLLRHAGQGVGDRPRRRALGGLRRAGRQPDLRCAAGRGRLLLRRYCPT
jgi:catechol 2,3-dioxygenase-like lactoylglutathione lyase family enzyme